MFKKEKDLSPCADCYNLCGYELYYKGKKIKDEYILDDFDNRFSYKVTCQSIDNFKSNFDNLEFFINHRKNDMITIFAIKSKNLAEYLRKAFVISSGDNYVHGNIYIEDVKINHGFIIDKYIVITDNDIENNSYSSNYYNPSPRTISYIMSNSIYHLT